MLGIILVLLNCTVKESAHPLCVQDVPGSNLTLGSSHSNQGFCAYVQWGDYLGHDCPIPGPFQLVSQYSCYLWHYAFWAADITVK
jgi:hypothetical protein